ncbi:MAG: lysophospholipid acyltransferase family protein [Planctomycetota bacterium]|jgi:1-acyl-sn-glycerol-3-phosphate acyltransferase
MGAPRLLPDFHPTFAPTIEEVAALDRDGVRARVPGWLAGYLDLAPAVRETVRADLARVLAASPDAKVQQAIEAYRVAGAEYGHQRVAPLARQLARIFMRELLSNAQVLGVHHALDVIGHGPVLMVSNHQSYCDSQVVDTLLPVRIADEMVLVAGPKVYEDSFRRLAAISFDTLKTAQSTRLDHNEAALSPRQVAVIALRTVKRAGELMAAGRPVMLYPEGGRTRTGRLRPFLKAAARYAAFEGARIVPVALSGSGAVLPRGEKILRPASVRIAVCESIPVDPRQPTEAFAEAWRSLAEALPEVARPEPGTDPLR